MNNKGGQGFTIVELLIVIVVIAILAVVVIIAYNGIISRAYSNRSTTEMASIAKAVNVFHTINGRYPADVDRGIPAEVSQYINGSSSSWPLAPWPNSEYDYDYFIGSDGKEVSQMSIRFCPLNGDISTCRFPKESWAASFGVNSSVYWCITGKCKAHPSQADNYPGRCLNCTIP